MARYSLQDVIKVENEIQATLQSEKEKSELWLKKKKKQLQEEHTFQLELLQQDLERERKKRKTQAQRAAEEKLQRATELAGQLLEVDDDILEDYLQKHLIRVVSGDIP